MLHPPMLPYRQAGVRSLFPCTIRVFMLQKYRGIESILVADDEPLVLSLARMILRNHGYQVLLAKDGKEALDLHQQSGHVDLLLTDVIMPMMTGPELAHALKQEVSDLRCVFMSGYDREQIQTQGVEGLGCDFLRKPFTPHALLKIVRETLDADKEPDPN
ncbi:MAG: multi-sensor hybrid histidine kinase [Bryobacterales bacterium]|nr:multi-sensor hybrid histidine kinase [Bryobacterales bacterium]